jgi:hypothetical protein
LRCPIENPGENDGQRETGEREDYHDAWNPLRCAEERRHRARHLDQRPAADCVDARHSTYVATLQLADNPSQTQDDCWFQVSVKTYYIVRHSVTDNGWYRYANENGGRLVDPRSASGRDRTDSSVVELLQQYGRNAAAIVLRTHLIRHLDDAGALSLTERMCTHELEQHLSPLVVGIDGACR